MVFFGAIVRTVTGGIQKINNESIIDDLEREAKKDFFEGFTEEEKHIAEIKLAQVKLELALAKGRPQHEIITIEKEIIKLMEQDIKIKMDRLRQKEATQLDIANTMIAIQKMHNDLKAYIQKLESEQLQNNSSQIAFAQMNENKLRRIEEKLKRLGQNVDNHHQKLSHFEISYRKVTEEIELSKRILHDEIDNLDKKISSIEVSIQQLNKTAVNQKKINFIVYFLIIFVFVLAYKVLW